MDPKEDSTRAIDKKLPIFPFTDVAEPNLFREYFNYDAVPSVCLNSPLVPTDMPEDIWITDTTFRDGQQGILPYTAEQIAHLYDLLAKLSGPNGVIRSSEFFLYTKKDQEAVYRCLEMGRPFPEVTGWIRASKKDLVLVKQLELKETGILMSCSDYHIFYKLQMTRREAAEHYIEIAKECLRMGVVPRCHLEDITRADFYGFVVPFVVKLMELSQSSKLPIKIRACDTMGYGITYPGADLPRSVPGIVHGLVHQGGVPHEWLEWHGHNDFYGGVTNACYAWLYGASVINGSLLGIGERAGNIPLEAMVMEYAQFRGSFNGMEPWRITEIAEYYEKDLQHPIPPATPFVGRDFNTTQAGVHVDGLLKNEETYSIFNTEKVLHRPAKVTISNLSGTSGIIYWLNKRFQLEGQEAVDKNSPIVQKMKEWIARQYAEGRRTAMTEEELEKAAHFFLQDGC